MKVLSSSSGLLLFPSLTSSLVPVSLPSKEKKSMKGLQVVSIILFLVECLCVLLYAYLIRYFYHFELFKDFYGTKLPDMVHVETFDTILVGMVLATLSVLSVASLLLWLCNYCCHPKSTLFLLNKKPQNNGQSS